MRKLGLQNLHADKNSGNYILGVHKLHFYLQYFKKMWPITISLARLGVKSGLKIHQTDISKPSIFFIKIILSVISSEIKNFIEQI